MNKTFFTQLELLSLGFKSLGENVLVSRLASIISPEKISLGDNSRIDDFCVLTGEITIGAYVHISAHCSLFGESGIYIDDNSGISSQSIIYSTSDDFSGNALVGPQVSSEYRNVIKKRVIIEKFVQIGAVSVVMPGVVAHEGAVTGAYTFVKTELPAWTISAGIPSKVIKERSQKVLELVGRLKNEKSY